MYTHMYINMYKYMYIYIHIHIHQTNISHVSINSHVYLMNTYRYEYVPSNTQPNVYMYTGYIVYNIFCKHTASTLPNASTRKFIHCSYACYILCVKASVRYLLFPLPTTSITSEASTNLPIAFLLQRRRKVHRSPVQKF